MFILVQVKANQLSKEFLRKWAEKGTKIVKANNKISLDIILAHEWYEMIFFFLRSNLKSFLASATH